MYVYLESNQVCSCELFHAIGLGILTFVIFPQLDAVKAVMLTNSMSMVPAILSKFPLNVYDPRQLITFHFNIQTSSAVRRFADATFSATKRSICSPSAPNSPAYSSGPYWPPPPSSIAASNSSG